MLSQFLAKVIGLYFIIFSIPLLRSPDQVKKRAMNLLKDEGAFLGISLFTLILGILMVVAHNIWDANWTLLITLICWLTFIKGVFLVVFPTEAIKFGRKMYEKCTLRYCGIAYLVIGLFLIYKGVM